MCFNEACSHELGARLKGYVVRVSKKQSYLFVSDTRLLCVTQIKQKLLVSRKFDLTSQEALLYGYAFQSTICLSRALSNFFIALFLDEGSNMNSEAAGIRCKVYSL